MSRRLPVLKTSQIIRILKKLGFYEARQKGAHICFKHPDGRFTLVPRHGNEDIGRGLLRQILREINISPEEFSKLLWNTGSVALLFFLFRIFGYYLIKATYEQARRKEEAQKTAIQERFSKEEAIWTARQLQRFNETLEQSVKLRTKELEEAKNTAEQKAREAESKRQELEKLYNVTLGREVKMGELKGKIKELEEKLKGENK